MTINRRKPEGKPYEYQLTDGRWLSISELKKQGICKVHKITLSGRLTAYFTKDKQNTQFTTVEAMCLITKTKGKILPDESENKPEDIFTVLNRLMPIHE